jgi:pimeloyl-ACP methyl ester carboxylesterase
MAFIERDGVKLFYEEAGRDTEAAPLLLVHGWTCFHGHLEPQAAHFAPTRRVVSVDLRGHGQSDVTGPFTVETFADDLAWLCEAVDLRRPVVIGHSMGGQVAVQLATIRPDLVRAAVALDSPFAPAGALAAGVGPLLATIEGPDHLAARKAMIDGMFGPYDDPQHAAEVAAVMLATPVRVTADAIASVLQWDGEGALRSCTVPVLTVHASPGPPMDTSHLAADCPHLTVGQTVGAGHFIQLEVPDQVNAMLERFLRMVG